MTRSRAQAGSKNVAGPCIVSASRSGAGLNYAKSWSLPRYPLRLITMSAAILGRRHDAVASGASRLSIGMQAAEESCAVTDKCGVG